MSTVQQLIEKLCPQGVEYRPLGDVATLQRGTSITRKNISEGEIPVIAGGQQPAYYHSLSNREGETIVVAGSGAYAGFLTYWQIPIFVSDAFSIKPNPDLFLTKFVFYFLANMQAELHSLKRGGGVPHVYVRNVAPLRIPLPPLPVQEEIVRILDEFSTLITELQSALAKELAARKKQYEYYRDELLSFGNEVEWKALGQIALFKYGYTDRAKEKGTVRFIRITDIGDNGKLRQKSPMFIDLSKDNEVFLVKFGDLLMARTGATYGKTMLFDDDTPSVYASFLIRIRFKDKKVLPKYYWHFAQSSFYWTQANAYVSKAGQPQFNANALKKVKIPLPSLSEQERIVSILDKFDALVNDLSAGIPAEIEARQKQYEYYRDKLLTFKELERIEA
ncbi:MAG: restriction endonuclease subunit S [Candidatus Hydrogenedens sp.]|jgi:type I restriction enzyme S subunit|nr:restriction endonuclease subunit S [Candidatus Hydrogenedens sp.]